ncbi:uncharacterized protein BYT42DRAFT_383706 [Radiomyces spectabilis]|uniref:uncharacterized protein n=1 Tax=Radiomyces spectabilis TaxID=64574 RepID=UPI00221FAC7D|nr:uncharacterized protein BYT42DRAFT_383706 [Radiomyces spectabilis]KAI8376341.1 hypothetical protein BYT42DRAFT_383706 [Radiomyces spectabilis]
MIEVHGSAEDEMPGEARVAGTQAAANAAQGVEGTLQPPTGTTIPSTSQTTTRYPESDINVLVNLGVSRQEAIHALEMSGGNPDLAASLLFQN